MSRISYNILSRVALTPWPSVCKRTRVPLIIFVISVVYWIEVLATDTAVLRSTPGDTIFSGAVSAQPRKDNCVANSMKKLRLRSRNPEINDREETSP
jgi:hypothetical protein